MNADDRFIKLIVLDTSFQLSYAEPESTLKDRAFLYTPTIFLFDSSNGFQTR